MKDATDGSKENKRRKTVQRYIATPMKMHAHSKQQQQQQKPWPNLPLKAVKYVAPLNIPLLATTRECTCAVNQPPPINAHHAHLLHRADKSKIPSTLADSERGERKSRQRVLSNILVGLQNEGCVSLYGLGVVFNVPDTNSRVKRGAGLRGVDEALLGGAVRADESGEIESGEAFGSYSSLLV